MFCFCRTRFCLELGNVCDIKPGLSLSLIDATSGRVDNPELLSIFISQCCRFSFYFSDFFMSI